MSLVAQGCLATTLPDGRGSADGIWGSATHAAIANLSRALKMTPVEVEALLGTEERPPLSKGQVMIDRAKSPVRKSGASPNRSSGEFLIELSRLDARLDLRRIMTPRDWSR